MNVPSVHLGENVSQSRRSSTAARAFPIGEMDRPTRGSKSPEELNRIVRYLDVETSARYRPGRSSTFCNIYACDFCYLAGVYLPRVWWAESSLGVFAAGKPVSVKYGQTVVELNANSLYAWLRDFGPTFGWRPAASIDELQAAANAGQVSVICARRKILSSPGHISMVVPESEPPLRAERDGSYVRLPLQSQAGRRNFCFSCGPGRWWEGAQFQTFGFWTHI